MHLVRRLIRNDGGKLSRASESSSFYPDIFKLAFCLNVRISRFGTKQTTNKINWKIEKNKASTRIQDLCNAYTQQRTGIQNIERTPGNKKKGKQLIRKRDQT